MTQAKEISTSVVKCAEVINVNVKNKQHENLGKIEELVIDKLKGNIRYAVLSVGGILGLGDKLFAIPWKLLRYDEDQKAFVVNISKDTVKKTEGFNKNNWPDAADEMWNSDAYQYDDVTIE